MRRALFLALLLAACVEPGPPPAEEPQWRLVSLDGAPFGARATLSFTGPGRIGGQAPCNHYFGENAAAPPHFAARDIGATMMACAALPLETRYFAALTEMTRVEESPGRLRLSNAAGREMVFAPAQP